MRDLLIGRKDPKETEVYGLLSYIQGERFLGNGLVTTIDYVTWVSRHRIISPAFKRSYLRRSMSQFNASTNLFLDWLRRKADGSSIVTLADEFPRVTFDSLAKVAFTLEIGAFEGGASFEVYSAVVDALRGFREAVTNPFFRFGLLKRGLAAKARAGARKVRAIARQCINARLSALKNDDDAVPDDILTLILRGAIAENHRFSLEDVVDEFVTLFIAGTETSASVMSFVLLELADHPDIRRRLCDEISDVFGGESRPVEFDDLLRFPYLDRVIKEVLRRYPPAPGSGRELRTPMKVDGYWLPAGTIVASANYVSHHMETNFEKPFEFNPDRFQKAPSVYQYYPFSVGPRSCIGRNFANIEARVILARFLHTFEFSLLPGQPKGSSLLMILSPRSRLLSTLKLREKKEFLN